MAYAPHGATCLSSSTSCNLLSSSRDLLLFELELTLTYWKSLLTGDGWSLRYCSISSLNLTFIPPTFSEKIGAKMMNTAFLNMIDAKLSEQRNADRFKFTNQGLAWFWTTLGCNANQRIQFKHNAVNSLWTPRSPQNSTSITGDDATLRSCSSFQDHEQWNDYSSLKICWEPPEKALFGYCGTQTLRDFKLLFNYQHWG